MTFNVTAQVLPFTDADYSPVTAAKGSTSVVETSSIAYASFSNSAAIPFSDLKGDFAVGYSLWQPSAMKSNVIGFGGAFNFNNKFGIAGGFSYGINPEYEIYDATGIAKGTFKPSQTQVNVGLSWRFIPYLGIGVNLGYAGQSLTETDKYGAFNTDIFLMSQFKGVKIAAGISNLGSSVASASGVKFSLPTSVTLGVGYDATFAEKHAIDVNADVDYYFYKAFSLALGAGYAFNDLLFVRAGYHYGNKTVTPSFASLGVGFKVFGVTIDAAYLLAGKTSAIRNTLCLSAGYRF